MSTPAKSNTSSAEKKSEEADPPRTPDVRRFFETEAKEGRDVEPKAKAKSGSTKKKPQLVIVDDDNNSQPVPAVVDDNNSQPAPDVVTHNEVATIEVKLIYIYIYFFV